jgi:hypothetical protein
MAKRRLGRFLLAEGFAPVSTRFYRRSEAGDFAIVGFQGAHMAQPGRGFYINLAVVTAPTWDWHCWRDPAATVVAQGVPSTSYNDWFRRVMVPASMYLEGGFRSQIWYVNNDDDVQQVAEAAAAEMNTVSLPEMNQMLDRDHLASMRPGIRLRFVAERGPSAELDQLIEQELSNDEPPHGRFVDWLHDYARRQQRRP